MTHVSTLLRHLQTSRNIKNLNTKVGIRYPCDQCEDKATGLSHLKRHKRSKHELPLWLMPILCYSFGHSQNTALFGKVYRTIFQERDDDLFSLCTSKIILIKIAQKYFLSIYLHILIFVIKWKHSMNNYFYEFEK